eukprot:6156102-Alexandrium_andersonii.AAC.1
MLALRGWWRLWLPTPVLRVGGGRARYLPCAGLGPWYSAPVNGFRGEPVGVGGVGLAASLGIFLRNCRGVG